MNETELYNSVIKAIENLYGKGKIKYETFMSSNDKWFVHKDNKRAIIVEIDIEVETDKLNPLSETYDEDYIDALHKFSDVNGITKYFGEPNLVITVDYELDENHKVLYKEFKKITKDIAKEFIQSEYLDMSVDEFISRYQFIIYPKIVGIDGSQLFRPELNIISATDVEFCRDFEKEKLLEITKRVIKERGYEGIRFIDYLCEGKHY